MLRRTRQPHLHTPTITHHHHHPSSTTTPPLTPNPPLPHHHYNHKHRRPGRLRTQRPRHTLRLPSLQCHTRHRSRRLHSLRPRRQSRLDFRCRASSPPYRRRFTSAVLRQIPRYMHTPRHLHLQHRLQAKDYLFVRPLQLQLIVQDGCINWTSSLRCPALTNVSWQRFAR